MRGILYGRLSQDRSGLSENTGIQTAEGTDYCHDQGWPIAAQFVDDDTSASRYTKKTRPGYQDMLAFIKADTHHDDPLVIVITEMPRLYRKLEELLDLIRLAETTPLGKIETTNGMGYDLTTGQGIHAAVTAVSTGVLESRKTSDRTKRKKTFRAGQGRFNGGSRPYGYDYVPSRGKEGDPDYVPPGLLTVNEREAEVIRNVVKALLTGRPLRSIIVELNALEVPTPSGKGLWHPTPLRRILTSPRIAGVRVHHGQHFPAQWDAIVSKGEWEELQLVVTGPPPPSARTKLRVYLLSGLCYCGLCGNKLVSSGTASGTRGEPNRKYRCRTIDHYGKESGCGKIVRAAEPLEWLVSEAVIEALDSKLMAQALHATDDHAKDDGLRALVDDYRGHKARLDDLVTDYASGLLSRDQLALAKRVVEDAMAATQAKMAGMQDGRVLASLTPGQSIRAAWDAAANDIAWRRTFVTTVIEKIILHPGRAGGRRWPTDNSPMLQRVGRQWQFDPDQIEIVWKV